jgi:hypothetical protein
MTMSYPVSQKITNILQHSCQQSAPRKDTDRGELAASLSNAISDNTYHTIWIDSEYDYKIIDRYLSAANQNANSPKHIIIYQVEEDWFRNLNFDEVRLRIKNHPNWTEKSFIVTNSRQDKQRSIDLGMNTVCRPGLLDLITYCPYNTEIVTINNITHHTGVCWSRFETDRHEIWKLLRDNRNKVAVAKLGKIWRHDSIRKNHVINNLTSGIVQFNSNNSDAPYQPIESDLWWSQYTAFGTVIESHHRDSDSKLLKVYAPTTSEKTYRNMHLLRPAVICGGLNTRQYLLDLGFDTWDWFIDWSFDSVRDSSRRFVRFKQEVQRLLDTPLDQLVKLINDNQDKLLYNRDRLFWLINNYETIDL